jgi:pyruvate kinase
MFRRTKIVATLGPATDDPNILRDIIQQGVNVVRLNFSHGNAEDQKKRADWVREIAQELGLHVAILGDLQGPKIRISTFAQGQVELKVGQDFCLDARLAPLKGTAQQVGLDYKHLPQDLNVGDQLMLDDGRIQLKVSRIDGEQIHTEVLVGGTLSNKKGINKKGGGLSAEALTDKDKQDIQTAAAIGVDYLAVSFPRTGADLHDARQLARAAGCDAKIIAKVERAEAVASVEAMDEIIVAADAIMVARGDLGVEIGDPELLGVQKQLIQRSLAWDRPVITATQMMESMVHASMPTRAEVMDVANAVLDGTDAVMLSAETATGDYPVETVQSMANVCLGAERHPSTQISRHRLEQTFDDIEEATAMSAMYMANHLKEVKAIVAITASGNTPLLMSRISSKLPILGISYKASTLNRMALFRGVKAIHIHEQTLQNTDVDGILAHLVAEGFLEKNSHVIVTYGDTMHAQGSTNSCKAVQL